MNKCELNDFPCVGIDYSIFDSICSLELNNAVTAQQIVNESAYCTFIPMSDEMLEGVTSNDYVTNLKRKVGLYHLWADWDSCDDHERHTLKGVYVGKGFADKRVLTHIRDKWGPDRPLYVTFYECENRIAKYLEQLFLDVYDFEFNSEENHGQAHLYAVWEEDRHIMGTETYSVSEAYAKAIGPGPYEVG